MIRIDIDDICQSAIIRWGELAQIDIAIEECAELIQALSKYKRNVQFEQGDAFKIIKNVREEIADVIIMITQLEVIFNREEIKKETIEKLLKLENILKG